METKLLPCPKCNGKATLNEGPYDFDGGGRYYAFSAEFECLECGLLFKVHNDYPKKYVEHDAMWDFAIEAWNARHERTCEIVYEEDMCPRCGECGCVLYSTSGYCSNCGTRLKDATDAD